MRLVEYVLFTWRRIQCVSTSVMLFIVPLRFNIVPLGLCNLSAEVVYCSVEVSNREFGVMNPSLGIGLLIGWSCEPRRIYVEPRRRDVEPRRIGCNTCFFLFLTSRFVLPTPPGG